MTTQQAIPETISLTLLAIGWDQDKENPNKFFLRRQGKALYVYPNLGLLKYWPDIRTSAYCDTESINISQEQLLKLIAKQ